MWSVRKVAEVYQNDPLRLPCEEARAKDEAITRLRYAKSFLALKRALEKERVYAADTPEFLDAEKRSTSSRPAPQRVSLCSLR